MDTLFSEGMRSACLIRESSKIQTHYAPFGDLLETFALPTSCLKYKEKERYLNLRWVNVMMHLMPLGFYLGPFFWFFFFFLIYF